MSKTASRTCSEGERGGQESRFLRAQGTGSPRIVSLCCAYPNPSAPGLGLFVQRRLQYLAKLLPLEVVAPSPMVQYFPGRLRFVSLRRRHYPGLRQDGTVAVVHPRWFYLPNSGVLTAVWLALQLLVPLLRLRKRFAFQIIDTHFGHPEGIAGSLLSGVLGVPFTITLRGNEPKHSRSWLARRAMRWALRRAARVFTVSERLRQFAIGLGAHPAKVKTIPNGVDTAVFHRMDRQQYRLKHGIPLDCPLIISAGALVERKGHHRVIAALRSLAPETGARLAVVGGPGPEGQYEDTIRRTATELGLGEAVRFWGPVSPEVLAELMAAADVCCLASTNEGWPNVVHEALACGTPVVATDVGAVPDMLDGGRYGIIVPVNDQAALEQGLRRALAGPWDRAAISRWGCARSWDQVAQEVAEQICEVISGGDR